MYRTRIILAAACLAAVSTALFVPALADTVAAPSPYVDPNWWVTPVVLAATGLFTTFVGWVLYRFLGIHLDRDARERLHMALATGASLVLARYAIRPAPGGPGPPATLDAPTNQEVVNYAKRSVPGSLKRLAPDADLLADLATAKLQDALTQAAAAR